jgi:hypothetical protein
MTSERALLLVLLGAAVGCADFSRGPASPAVDASAPSEAGTDGAVVSFGADIHAFLISGCQHCHSAGQQAGDTSYLLTGDATADYAAATQFVDVASPTQSRLLAKMSGNGHDGGTIYAATTPQYETILSWIRGGARP